MEGEAEKKWRVARMATCGNRACFHGAYADRERAERKAEARNGRVLKRKIGKKVRYVVVTGKG